MDIDVRDCHLAKITGLREGRNEKENLLIALIELGALK